jgi:hypothetical protein
MTEQYQRYFFVNRMARRPTWTNPILNERRASERRSVRSRQSIPSEEAPTLEILKAIPGPNPIIKELADENQALGAEPVLEEQSSPQELEDENQAPGAEPVVGEEPGPHESMNKNQLPHLESDLMMSGALVPREDAPPLVPAPDDNARTSVPKTEERSRSRVSDHEEQTDLHTTLETPAEGQPSANIEQNPQISVTDVKNQTASDTPAKIQPQISGKTRRSRKKSKSRKREFMSKWWHSGSKCRHPMQHPQTQQNQTVPPQLHLEPHPPPRRSGTRTRSSNQRGAQSHSPPTVRPQRQRQTQSEEHPHWMPDMTGYEGSDGARFYWLDPTYIARQEAEQRYRQLEIEAATRLWENSYRGSGYVKVNHRDVGGMANGGGYGMGSAGGWAAFA